MRRLFTSSRCPFPLAVSLVCVVFALPTLQLLGCGPAAVGAGDGLVDQVPAEELASADQITYGLVPSPPDLTADVPEAEEPILRAGLPSAAFIDPEGLAELGIIAGGDASSRAPVDQASLPPIGNQGPYGSCVSWATGYAAASYAAAHAHGWTPNAATYEASPAFLYPRAGARLSGFSCPNSGTAIVHTLQILTETGAPSLTTVPYTLTNLCSTTTSGNGANLFRLDGYATVDGRSSAAVKTQIAAGNPVVWGAQVYRSWNDWANKGPNDVYSSVTGSLLGGHAMVVIGYDDAKQAFLVQNSWGTFWGYRGYAWMAYSAFEATSYDTVYGSGNAFILYKAGIQPSPMSLDFGLAGTSDTVTLNKTGSGTANPTWSVTDNQTWLSVSPASGSGAATLTVSVSRDGLGVGSYSGTITIATPNGPSDTVTVSMTTDTSSIGLNVTPATLSFGSTTKRLSARLASTAGTAVDWTAATDQPWLAATPSSGAVGGTVYIDVNRTGLASGSYTGTVTFSAPAGDKTVSVSMSVPNNKPTITSITAAPNANVNWGATTTLTCVATDLDGDALTYLWTGPGGMADSTSPTATWTAPSANRTYTLSCKVTDQYGAYVTATVTVAVQMHSGGQDIIIN